MTATTGGRVQKNAKRTRAPQIATTTTMTVANGKSKPEVIGDDEVEENVKKSAATKFLNYLFCRGDLAEEKLSAQPVALKDLFRYATTPDYLLLVFGVIGSICSGLCQPVLSILAGLFMNVLLKVEASSDEFIQLTTLYTALYFSFFIFCVAANYAQFVCFQRVCCRLVARIRHEYVRSILRQEPSWFDNHSCGSLTTQLNDNIERIRDGIGDKLGLLLRGLAMFIVALGVSFYHDWRIAILMSPVAPLTCACMNFMSRKMAMATSRELSDVGNAGAVAEEAILGVRTVQALNGQDEMVERYRKELSRGSEHALLKSNWSGFLGGLFYVILFTFMGGGVLLGGHLMSIGQSQGGLVLTAVISMLIAAYFLGLVSPQLMVVLNARVAAAVIYKTIDRIPKIDVYGNEGQVLPEVVGEVEFRDVRFRYAQRKDVTVLDGFSLKIPSGKTVALVGHSGCGKSTAVGLLSRLYEAESGNVLIDGVNVKKLKLSCLREVVGVVQQEPALFCDTVRENIKMSREDISDEEMERVCRMANAHDFIMKLPKGYDTIIGDGGVQLSGGQKQRVAIARTLARNPRILLLDEATSALDGHSEGVVQEALDRASQGRTTIVIAHRLATVINADLIVVVDKGRVVEKGKHTELMAADGRYAALAKAQAMQKTEEPPRSRTTSTSEFASGAEAFMRGVQAGNSFRSSHMSTGNVASDVEPFPEVVAPLAPEEESSNDVGLFAIYAEASSYKWLLTVAFVFAVLRGAEMPISSVIWGQVYMAMELLDTDNQAMMRGLLVCFIYMLLMGLYILATHFIASMLFGRIAERLILDFRARTFRNILLQDAAYFDKPEHSPGKVITRLAADAPNVKAVVDSRMMLIIAYLSACIVSIIVSSLSCWPLGLLAIILSLALGLFLTRLTKTIQRRNLKLQKHNPAGKIAVEIIENVKTIQLLTGELRFYGKYEDASRKVKETEVKNGYLEATNFAVSQSFIFFSIGSSYALGSFLIRQGLFPVAFVYQAVLATMLSCIAVMLCSTFYPEFVKAKTAATLMFQMMKRPSATGEMTAGERKPLTGDLKFEEVHFTYPQRPQHPVMRGLNFSVKRGQTVALVGPSGSGKSTVISMLERLYDTAGGAVRFDGTDVKEMSLHHLRTQMALVGQEPRLFSGSIKENICFGMGTVEEEKVRKALQMANADNFISGLPQGLDTEVGEKGTQLSGGQKQRIAIARALVREPVVLLLDEATSALDGQSERAVQDALDEARKGRTCITVAHRLSSIQNADEILFVEEGRVRERGTHSQLMRLRGKYYDLVKKQDLEGNEGDDSETE